MKAPIVFGVVLTIGLCIFLLTAALVSPGGDRSLLDLSPQAAAAYNERVELAHAEEMARIEARRQFNERVLILVGVLGAVGIVAFAAAGRRPVPRVTVSLPPHIRPEQIESFWAAQDEQMRVRGFLVDHERR